MAEQMIQHKEGEKVATQTIPTGYKQTEVGVIPEDWSVESLSQVAQITRGKFSARPRNDPKFFGGDIPFIQTGDITRSNGYDVNFSQTINELGLSVSRLFPAGSLFFTIAANIGDVAIAKYPAACPDSLVVIKENGHINKQWLYHILSSKKESFESIATSNAQLNINLEKLNPYVLGVPALEEQTAIANVLSDTDALIAVLEQLIAKKQAIKTATMQQLLTGRTRLPQFALRPDGTQKGYKSSELGQIPEDWVLADIRSISAVPMQNGLFYEPIRKGKGVPLINVGDMYTAAPVDVGLLELFDASLNEIKLFKAVRGDLFFTRSSVVPSGIAYCNIFDSERNDVVFDSHLIRVRPNVELVDPKYLYLSCISKYARSALIAEAKTATMTTIDQGAINRCPVLVPPKNEQTAIATILSDMDSELTALEQKLAKARDVKQGMMQQLLTGRIRLPLPQEA